MKEPFKLKYKPLGSIAALIEWPKLIDRSILNDINRFKHTIAISMGEYILETVPAYNSLTVFFDTSRIKYSEMVKKLKELYDEEGKDQIITNRIWRVPVCYDTHFGLDLKELSKNNNLSVDEVIDLHSNVTYDIYFIGFLPGFLYLGGLNEQLACERKDKPRASIRSGDVGIAGKQTGIYPRVSPGGWNIIGNSPIRFFDTTIYPPCFAVSGDRLQFVPIDLKRHQEIKRLVEENSYQLESDIYE